MLLRRVIEHVRSQNWTAVAVDFVIVVVGVFIGIQVSNWNDTRQDRATGRIYLERIANDIAADAGRLEASIETWAEEIRHAETIARFLSDGAIDGVSEWELFQLIYYRAGWAPFSPDTTTYDELIGTGQFRLVGNAELRKEIGEYYDGLRDFGGFYEFETPLREAVRGKYPPIAQRYMWDVCFSDEQYRASRRGWTDCPPIDDPQMIAGTLAALRDADGLLDATRYVLSVRLVALDAASTDLERARALSAKIKGYR